jgi:hypothetical protein
MSSVLFDRPTINNIKSDTLQFGMALMLSHIFAGKSLFEKDCANSKTILLSLIGFAVYQSVVSKLFVTASLNPVLRTTIDDILKFSTMLYVSKYIGDYDNLYTKEFGLTTFNLVVSFLLYNSFVGKHLTSRLISDKLKLNQVLAVSDLVKFSFVLGLTGVLNQLSDVGKFDVEYFRLSLGYVTGLVTYDFFLS